MNIKTRNCNKIPKFVSLPVLTSLGVKGLKVNLKLNCMIHDYIVAICKIQIANYAILLQFPFPIFQYSCIICPSPLLNFCSLFVPSQFVTKWVIAVKE